MYWQDNLVPALFFITFALALVFAFIQYRKAKKAQREHHRSAGAEANHEPPAPAQKSKSQR